MAIQNLSLLESIGLRVPGLGMLPQSPTEAAMAGLPNIRADLGLETKEQRDMRLFQTGQLNAQKYQGFKPGLRAVAQGAAQNIPSIIDNVRQLGVEKGLPMQTRSELFDQALSNYDGSPQSQAATVQALTAIDPQWGAMMAQRLAENANNAALQNLQIQKLEQELNEPTEWKPMASLQEDGGLETVWVSPTGGVKDYSGQLLTGRDRPTNIFSINYAAQSLKDMGRNDVEADFMEREMINRTFIRGAGNAIRQLQTQPATNTATAAAGIIWNGLQQNLDFIASAAGIEEDLTPNEYANVQSQMEKLGIEGAAFRAMMMNLAYQKAKAMQGTSDRISDTDLNNALIAIGGDYSDAASIINILTNNIRETADAFGADWKIAFDQEIDAYGRLGATELMNNLGIPLNRDDEVTFQGGDGNG